MDIGNFATIKHPVIAGRESDIKATLTQTDEIRLSRKDQNVYRFTGKNAWALGLRGARNGEGFLITAYPTDTIKEGNHLWPK